MSRAAHISETQCYRLFKNALHTTPGDYLLSYRLRKSIALLQDSNKSVTDIAHRCGFSSLAYFAKKFRIAYGVTPRQFRGSDGSPPIVSG